MAVEEVRRSLGDRRNARGFRLFSSEARVLALGYAHKRLGAGASSTEVASELGLVGWTLQRWLQQEQRGDAGQVEGFVQLKVKAPPSPAAGVVVHGPCGVWVEGLEVEGIAQLIRSLSCSA